MGYECGVKLYDEKTTIELEGEAAALVVSPEEFLVYLPNMDEEEDVPVYVMLLSGIAVMLADDRFVERVLEIAEMTMDEAEMEMGDADS